MQDTAGELATTGSPCVGICIHIGPPAEVGCRRGDEEHLGIARHGDIDIIPANTDCLWRIDTVDAVLAVGLYPALLNSVAEETGKDPAHLAISNRFQIRDPQLERLCWAIRDEMEAGYPTGKIYMDSLATAVAARLIHDHSSISVYESRKRDKIAPAKLRQVLSYIEDRLGEGLSLRELANFAGMSQSHFKALFREAMGMPVHRYVVQRRVERAAWLLKHRDHSVTEIALQTGFSHQSHLALQMRRVLGQSPQEIRKRAV